MGERDNVKYDSFVCAMRGMHAYCRVDGMNGWMERVAPEIMNGRDFDMT